jgi:hypothetical protein
MKNCYITHLGQFLVLLAALYDLRQFLPSLSHFRFILYKASFKGKGGVPLFRPKPPNPLLNFYLLRTMVIEFSLQFRRIFWTIPFENMDDSFCQNWDSELTP